MAGEAHSLPLGFMAGMDLLEGSCALLEGSDMVRHSQVGLGRWNMWAATGGTGM